MSSDNYSIPLNAYPLASTEGRPTPTDVVRPGWCLAAKPYQVIKLPEEVNYVTVFVETPLLLKELGNTLPAAVEATAIEALTVEPAARVAYLAKGERPLILSRFIMVSEHCIINGNVLWQQIRPTTQWRTGHVN